MINIDGEFNDLSESRGWKSGTTAIVSLIHGNTLVSACVGDSKSVLYKGGEATVMNKVSACSLFGGEQGRVVCVCVRVCVRVKMADVYAAALAGRA